MPQSGVKNVSGLTRSIFSIETPIASAVICAITVFEPCPISVAPWCREILPSLVKPIFIVEGLGRAVLPQPYQQVAMPTPFLYLFEFLLKAM